MIKHNFDLFAGPKQLLKNTTLNITHPNRYGLIGYNGSGKSTLLKFLYEKYKDLNVYYVEQDFYDDSDKSILELILESNRDRSILIDKIINLEKNMDDLSDEDMEKYNDYNKELNNYAKDESDI